MKPGEKDYIEDAETFLKDVLGCEEDEDFGYSDGFKSFPPIKPVGKKKKKGLKFDVASKISEAKYTTDKESIKELDFTDKESKDPRVTFQETTQKPKQKSRNNILLKRVASEYMTKNTSRINQKSRNSLEPHSKTQQTLPKVTKPSQNTSKSRKNSSKPQKSTKPFLTHRPNPAQLAITNPSFQPKPKKLLQPHHGIVSQTSRQFAPKLNKDIPISPSLPHKTKSNFSKSKRSLQILSSKYSFLLFNSYLATNCSQLRKMSLTET